MRVDDTAMLRLRRSQSVIVGSGWFGCLRGQRRIACVWKRLRGGQASDDRDWASLGRGA